VTRTHCISRPALAILGLLISASLGACKLDGIIGPTSGCFILCDGIGPIGPLPDPPHTSVPTRVSGDRAYVDLAMTDLGTCAITEAGETWCWGVLPPAGNSVLVPTLLSTPIRFRTLVAGGDHFCGLGLAGGTYCWGANGWRLLGTEDSLNYQIALPSRVAGGDSLVQLSTTGLEWDRSARCGVTASRRAFCWGWNDAGQLGRDTAGTEGRVPAEVVGANAFVSIHVAPRATCALDDVGAAWCWGVTGLGLTGTNTLPNERDTPGRVSGGHTFSAIAVGAYHACGIEGGTVWCWGDEFSGALGPRTGRIDPEPRRMLGLPSASKLFIHQGGSCVVDGEGAAACWGASNYLGAAGVPDSVNTASPFTVQTTTRFSKLVLRSGSSCGLDLEGRAWCWGRSDLGRLGNGT